MDLLDRYLQSVRWWLPKGRDRDTLAELEVDLRAQIEEEESRLGRALDPAETARVLKRCGDPLTVAGRLLQEPPLLDPVWSMIYRRVARVVLLYVVPAILLATLLPAVVFSTAPGRALAQSILHGWLALVYAAGMITLAFGVLLHFGSVERWRASWDPLRLPKVRRARDRDRIPRAGSVVEVVIDLLFLLWWIAVPGGPAFFTMSPTGVVWGGSALWAAFHARWFWPVTVVAALHLTLALVNLERPVWSRTRLGARACLDAATAAMVLSGAHQTLAAFHGWARALRTQSVTVGTPGPVGEVVAWLALVVVGIIAAVSAVVNLVRLVRAGER